MHDILLKSAPDAGSWIKPIEEISATSNAFDAGLRRTQTGWLRSTSAAGRDRKGGAPNNLSPRFLLLTAQSTAVSCPVKVFVGNFNYLRDKPHPPWGGS